MERKGGVPMRRCSIWIILISVWMGSAGFAPGAIQAYSRAVEFAKAGQVDFAFMYFNELMRNYPESKYREQAFFAVGEYYFRISGLRDAEESFKAFIEEYPDSKQRLYALAYLLNIAEKNQDAVFVQALEKQIIDLQQVSFIFRETKEVAYQSALYQNYKAVIHSTGKT